MEQEKYGKLYELGIIEDENSWYRGYAYSHDIDKLTQMVKNCGGWTIITNSKTVRTTDVGNFPIYEINEVNFII